MRNLILVALVLVFADSGRAEETPQATGILEGKHVKFPEKSIPEGVKAAVDLLQSCHDESPYQAGERRKALRGDHVRMSFPTPRKVTVMRETFKISSLIVRLPMNTGVFWVKSKGKWRRYTKYEFPKQKPFEAWLRMAQPAE